jgi:hypothetical protein
VTKNALSAGAKRWKFFDGCRAAFLPQSIGKNKPPLASLTLLRMRGRHPELLNHCGMA